jgi:hypothetical protein
VRADNTSSNKYVCRLSSGFPSCPECSVGQVEKRSCQGLGPRRYTRSSATTTTVDKCLQVPVLPDSASAWARGFARAKKMASSGSSLASPSVVVMVCASCATCPLAYASAAGLTRMDAREIEQRGRRDIRSGSSVNTCIPKAQNAAPGRMRGRARHQRFHK